MFKERKHMLRFLLISIIIIFLLTWIIFKIENTFILNLINTLSLSTGFIGFFISIYIIQYADDIRKELKIQKNIKEAENYLKIKFQQEYTENMDVIKIFQKFLKQKETEQIIISKSDLLSFLNTYEILLRDSSEGIFNFKQYVSRLKNKNFDKQISKPGNIIFVEKETIQLQLVSEILFKKLKGDN